MLRALLVMLCLTCASVRAQEARSNGPGPERVDGTRLDVERLPREALPAHRDLYSRGLFLEAQLGGTTFAGDLRAASRGGPRFAIGVGYELARWFALVLGVEGSLHQTKNRPPPAQTSYELMMATLNARFSLPIRAQHALSLGALFSVVFTTRDVLRGLDFLDSFRAGVAYGGELGYDYHLPARHHSLGVVAGARQLPSLQRDGVTLGIHAAGYLRYVF